MVPALRQDRSCDSSGTNQPVTSVRCDSRMEGEPRGCRRRVTNRPLATHSETGSLMWSFSLVTQQERTMRAAATGSMASVCLY